MPDQVIEFHAPPGADLLAPVPAKSMLPEWYRLLATATEGFNYATVKRCPPFLEALACGYYMLLQEEVRLTRLANGQVAVVCAEPLVEEHPAIQVEGTPMEKITVLKFLNRWLIRTPAGYSTLFMHPLNRFHMPGLTVLSGVVETDTYYREINFPVLCELKTDESLVLAKGLPIVQVVPIKREVWEGKSGDWDFETRLRQEDQIVENERLYRDEHWVPKKYEG